jgi:nucleoside-diphosphate-sugar epimerase
VRIVVTGAKGGTGISICRVLREAVHDVLGIDLKPAEPDDTAYARHDLVDGVGLHDLLAGAAGVVHFGSYPTDVWSSKSEAFRNVTVGGFNVFQACANLGIKRIALASSMEVYGNLSQQPHLPVTEESPLVPPGVYGASKVLLERLAGDYHRWHGISTAALRLGRIVYEESYSWRLERHTQSDASAAGALWCYVDSRDVATACQAWLESDLAGVQAFNVAAPDVCVETPTRDLLSRFCPQIDDLRAPFDQRQCPYDSSALGRALGWEPRYSWQDIRDEAAGGPGADGQTPARRR